MKISPTSRGYLKSHVGYLKSSRDYLKSSGDYLKPPGGFLKFLGGFFILFVGLALLFISQRFFSFAVWYAAYIYPFFTHTFGRFWGLFPFSVFEILLLLGPACLIVYCLIKFRYRQFNSRQFNSRQFKFRPQAHRSSWARTPAGAHFPAGARFLARIRLFSIVILYFLSSAFTIFVLISGINYNRESYADHIGITVQDSSIEELVLLYAMLLERAESLSNQIETDEHGHFVANRLGMYNYARLSMSQLNDTYGGLGSFFPRAKAPMASRLVLSRFKISGIFIPWTMEAHYNGDMPATSIPFVINHELAHFAGHMREDEANFIAYLASRDSVNVDFQYSAVYSALNYVLNALNQALPSDVYAEFFNLLPDQLKRDFNYAWDYWQAFAGPAADLQERFNDAYLRLNQQEDGVQSYGRMVDLLLAYYRDQLWGTP